MKNIKSKLSLLLALVMILSTFAPVLASDVGKNIYDSESETALTRAEALAGIKNKTVKYENLYIKIDGDLYQNIKALDDAELEGIKAYAEDNNMSIKDVVDAIKSKDADVIKDIGAKIVELQAKVEKLTEEEIKGQEPTDPELPEELKVIDVSAINPTGTKDIVVTVETTGADRVEFTLVGAGNDQTVEVETEGTATHTFENLLQGSYTVEVVAFDGEEVSELKRSSVIMITPEDGEEMTGIAGFVREGTEGVAGVTVQVGNRTTKTDYYGYFELSLPAGIHNVNFKSGAGEIVENEVIVVDGRTTGLIVDGSFGVVGIEENTITVSVLEDGKNQKDINIVLQAKELGKDWIDFVEVKTKENPKVLDNKYVAGTGFPHDVEYRFYIKGTGIYSNTVKFTPNPAKNIDLVYAYETGDNPDALKMGLTVNIKDHLGEDLQVVPEGEFELYRKKANGTWNETAAETKTVTTTTSAITFDELPLNTKEDVIVKYTPGNVGAEHFAVTTEMFTIGQEGKDQTVIMRLASKALAEAPTVNFQTADKKDFADANYSVKMYDKYDFPILVLNNDSSITGDKLEFNSNLYLGYGEYRVRISNTDDTKDGSMILTVAQDFNFTIKKDVAVLKEAVVNLGVNVNVDGSAWEAYDNDDTHETEEINRVIYANVSNKDVEKTLRFVYKTAGKPSTILPAGKDYTVVSYGFRLTEQEIDKDSRFDVKRKDNGEKESPTDDIKLQKTETVEAGAVVSGKVTRNGTPIVGATITAYLEGRKIAQGTSVGNGEFKNLSLPHEGNYTLVVRSSKLAQPEIATYEYKLDAKAGQTIKDLELKVGPKQNGEFTIIMDSEIHKVEVLDSYTADLGAKGYNASEGIITATETKDNVIISGKTVKVKDLTKGNYTVRLTPESKDLDPVVLDIKLGYEGATVTVREDFTSRADKRAVEVEFVNSKDGKVETVSGTLVVIDENGKVVEIVEVDGTTKANLEILDGNYTLKLVRGANTDKSKNFVGSVEILVDGVSQTVEMDIIVK